MAERRNSGALVIQFRRGGVGSDLRLMAAQGLLPLLPEDLLELWIDLVCDADDAVRNAAEASIKSFPVAELLPLIKRPDVPVSVRSRVLSRRAEPELREAFRVGEGQAQASLPVKEPLVDLEPEADQPGEISLTEDEAIVRYLSEGERQQATKVSAVRKLCHLSTTEKIIVALGGSREERSILIRDPNRLVSAAVLNSPRLTESEVESFSSMQNVSSDVLRYIGSHREWTKRYKVLSSLVRNPKTPIGIALSIVPRLNPRELRGVDIGRRPQTMAWRSDAREFRGARPFSSEELELLVRLSGLFVAINRSLGMAGADLTTEQRDQIEAALDRARAALLRGGSGELQACADELETARRLLENIPAASGVSSLQPQQRAPEGSRRHAPPRPPAPPAPPLVKPSVESRSAPKERWSDNAVQLYDSIIRSRLAEVCCRGCGEKLESASLIRTHTSVGLLLNEYQLGDMAAARLLAATDSLLVECRKCGGQSEVPAPVGNALPRIPAKS